MIDQILTNNKLYLKYIDNILGWGVFTNQDIKEGEIVEYCYCLPEKYTESQHRNYIYLLGDQTDDAYLVLGYGMIYNHSYDPNIQWEIIDFNRRIIKFVAIKDIYANEELRHNYGSVYWKARTKINSTII